MKTSIVIEEEKKLKPVLVFPCFLFNRVTKEVVLATSDTDGITIVADRFTTRRPGYQHKGPTLWSVGIQGLSEIGSELNWEIMTKPFKILVQP